MQDNATYSNLFNQKLPRHWINFGIWALALSVVFFALSHLIQKEFNFIYLNCYIYIFLISIANSIMSYNIKPQFLFLHRIILFFAYLSFMLMILCGFISNQTIITNHMPIIHNVLFIIGIALFTSLNLANSILNLFNHNDGSLIYIAGKPIALIFQIAFLVLAISLYSIQSIIEEYPIDLQYYYKMIFLGYGNILEFLYSNLLIVIWIISTQKILPINYFKFRSLQIILMCCNVVFVSISPFIYLYYRIDNYYVLEFFNTQSHLVYIIPCCSWSLIAINLFTYRKHLIYNNIELITLSLSGIIFFTASIITILNSKEHNLHYYSIAIAIIGYAYISLTNREVAVKESLNLKIFDID